MLGHLILLFTLLPLLELIILIRAARAIGLLYTVVIVILTGVSGAFLARAQGVSILIRIREDIEKGIMPGDKLIDGAMILAGGLTLLTPGFLTDAFGFILLIHPTRSLIKKMIKKKFRKTGFRDNTNYIDAEIL